MSYPPLKRQRNLAILLACFMVGLSLVLLCVSASIVGLPEETPGRDFNSFLFAFGAVVLFSAAWKSAADAVRLHRTLRGLPQ